MISHFSKGSRGIHLLAAVEESDFAILNEDSHTRLDSSPFSSDIDLTIVSAEISLMFNWEILEDPHDSDHLLIACGTSSGMFERQDRQINYRKFDWDKFSSNVEEALTNSTECITYERYFEILWNGLMNGFSSAQLRKSLQGASPVLRFRIE